MNNGKVIIKDICRLTYCIDCQIEEPLHYMVHDEVWRDAGLKPDVIVCLSCLQLRLDRKLERRDLTAVPLNAKFYRPLIFLDIDGVLNNHESHPRTFYCSIDRESAKELDQLLLDTKANIVLISSWRYLMDTMNLKGMQNLLYTHWIDGSRLIGWTRKDIGRKTDRGLQITEWLEQNMFFKKYVVVDNDDFGISKYGHPFVQLKWKLDAYYRQLIADFLK